MIPRNRSSFARLRPNSDLTDRGCGSSGATDPSAVTAPLQVISLTCHFTSPIPGTIACSDSAHGHCHDLDPNVCRHTEVVARLSHEAAKRSCCLIWGGPFQNACRRDAEPAGALSVVRPSAIRECWTACCWLSTKLTPAWTAPLVSQSLPCHSPSPSVARRTAPPIGNLRIPRQPSTTTTTGRQCLGMRQSAPSSEARSNCCQSTSTSRRLHGQRT